MRNSLIPWRVRHMLARSRAVAKPVRSPSKPVAREPLERRALFAGGAAPVGPEFAVNTHTSGSQEFFSEASRAVSSAADGSFVVTSVKLGTGRQLVGRVAQQSPRRGISAAASSA